MRSSATWSTVFLGMFILSIDVWRWGAPVALGPLGVPRWIYEFMGLQAALAVALYVFGRSAWRERHDGERDA